MTERLNLNLISISVAVEIEVIKGEESQSTTGFPSTGTILN